MKKFMIEVLCKTIGSSLAKENKQKVTKTEISICFLRVFGNLYELLLTECFVAVKITISWKLCFVKKNVFEVNNLLNNEYLKLMLFQ